MAQTLPPINTREDVEKHEAFEETIKVEFKNCRHKNVELGNGEIRCKCGASWSGSRLHELYELLTNR